MKRLRISTLAALLFLLLKGLTIQAQTYQITGKVLDSDQKEPLPGASVFLPELNKGTITDFNGNFQLECKATDVSLKISFIGYLPQSIPLNLLIDKSKNLTVLLEQNTTKLEEVYVGGEASGQMKAMIDQQKAENIQNIVSAEQIGKFPDMNAAEAMQRITGITVQRDQGEGKYIQLRGTPPEMTNFNINGEQIPSPEGAVRYVGMDIISADQIETIEVTKVLTPDMDGDGIAGSVNIVTQKAKKEIPEIKASLASGYNKLRGTPNYNLQLSYGARKNNLGVQINASYYQNKQGSDNIEAEFVKGPFWGSQDEGKNNYHQMYQELQLRYYETFRKRVGLSATIDYKYNKNDNIYLRGMFNQFSDKQTRSRKTYDLEDAVDINNYLYGGIIHDVKYRTKEQQVNTLNLGGENNFNLFKINYEVAYAQAIEETPDRLEAAFDNPGQALQITLDRDRTTFPKPIMQNPVHDSIANDYANFEFKGMELSRSLVNDNNITSKINIEIPINIQSIEGKGYLKFGGKIRRKNKDQDVVVKAFSEYNTKWFDFIYPKTRPRDELNLMDVSSGLKTDNLLNQGYVVEQIPDAQKMRDFYDFNSFLFYYGDKYDTESREKSLLADYTASESITAYYAMLNYKFRKLSIIAGLRAENTLVKYEGNSIIKNIRGYFDSTIVESDFREHNFLLPNIQIKYTAAEGLNIRAAYTESFSRPNFEDVLPIREEDRDNIKYGNPKLEYPYSKNLDLMVEQYLKKDGLLSAGLYYKKIEHFITPYKLHAFDIGVGSHVDIEMPINGKEADVFGVELQCQYKFGFFDQTPLPKFFSNFGIFSNYSFTYSDATMSKRRPANFSSDTIDIKNEGINVFLNLEEDEHISLPGQSKHAANLAFFYEGSKLYAKLSANYHDKYLLNMGGDADLDEYVDQAWQLDFTASYDINKQIKCFVDVMNMLNTPSTVYLGSTNYLQKQEYYSWSARLGFKLYL